MAKVIKARVLNGRYKDEVVRISNISADELGRQSAACILTNGSRANIKIIDLEIIPEEIAPAPTQRFAKTASMPFISGAASSRTLTQTKNMAKNRLEKKTTIPSQKFTAAQCEKCGVEYNLEDRKGRAGKITMCEDCAEETEVKMEGEMIFSHKTGATIEIKKDGELIHEADTFNYKK